jgi:hypothetical protein
MTLGYAKPVSYISISAYENNSTGYASRSFNISGFHIVALFNLSKEMVYIPSNTTK